MKNLIMITDPIYFALLFKVKQSNPFGVTSFSLATRPEVVHCTYLFIRFSAIILSSGPQFAPTRGQYIKKTKKRLRGTEIKKKRYKHAVEIK